MTPRILMLPPGASADFLHYSQEEVDAIVHAVYRAGFDNRVHLAEMAVAETGMGRIESKVIKNTLATQMVWDDIKNLKTVGVTKETDTLVEIAKPMGVVLGGTSGNNITTVNIAARDPLNIP